MPEHAHYLSIIGSDSCYSNWVCSNFIQIYYDCKNLQRDKYLLRFRDDFEWKHSEFFDQIFIKESDVKSWFESPIEMFVKFIDSGYYIMALIDSYFIANHTAFYGKKSRPHLTLIYGYSFENNLFYVADFFDGYYKSVTVSFHDILLGFRKNTEDTELRLIKRNNHNYYFDLKNVVTLLDEYHTSADSSYRQHSAHENRKLNEIYGLEAQRNMVDLYSRNNFDLEYLDVRTLHLLYEHKRIMNIRLSYLSLNVVNISPEILIRYSKLEKESLILRNLGMKCGFTKSYKTFDTIIYRFKQMIDEEEEILTLLLTQIKQLPLLTN